MQYEVEVNGRLRQVNVHRADGQFVVGLDGRDVTVDAARIDGHTLSLLVGGASHEVTIAADPASGQLAVTVGVVPLTVTLNGRRQWGRKDEGSRAGSGPQRLTAPMPGKVLRVLVQAGDVVQANRPLIVIEAMKMENELRAARDGMISEIHAREGQSVDRGALLLVVTPA